MGQRLNINIVENNKVLANSYFHWGGYTYTACDLVSRIITKFNEISSERKGLPLAVLLLQSSGAWFNDAEFEFARNITELSDIVNNLNPTKQGFIGISDNAKKEHDEWQDDCVYIHIDTKVVEFNVINIKISDELEDETIEIMPFDLSAIPFDEFNLFSALITEDDTVFVTDNEDEFLCSIC